MFVWVVSGFSIAVDVFGPVADLPTDAVGKYISQPDEIDAVVNGALDGSIGCCGKSCLFHWMDHWKQYARGMVSAYRETTAGMDKIQRMLFHHENLRSAREWELRETVKGDKTFVGR